MAMRFIILLSICALAYAQSQDKSCYGAGKNVCHATSEELKQCNSDFSGVSNVMVDLRDYVRQHLHHSFHYLLMSTHFNSYTKNRDGFTKLFRKLSDNTWEDAIDIMKYMTKRGSAAMSFSSFGYEVRSAANKVRSADNEEHHFVVVDSKREEVAFPMTESKSLSIALDLTKELATIGHNIHAKVSTRKNHDADTVAYLEENFVRKHADTVRELSGYTNDIVGLIQSGPPGLSLFLFDEYLKTKY